MEYRSMADLDRLTSEWARSLPRDFELVVGISQGGMLVARLLAWHLDCPVTDIQGLCSGRRDHGEEHERALTGKSKILVMDDRHCTGLSLADVKARIEAARLDHDIHYGAAIATPEAANSGAVEFVGEAVATPWLFEWELLHDPSTACMCVHFESVLAPDQSAPVIPDGKIGWVVTSRPESRRFETEVCLRNQGVRYRQLMMGCTDVSDFYRQSEADMLVVYSASEAAQLAARAGGPVFSIEAGSTMNVGDALAYRSAPTLDFERPVQASRRLANWSIRTIDTFSRRVLGRGLVLSAPEAKAGPDCDVGRRYRVQ